MFGQAEPIFDRLPQNVLDNLHRRGSENALLWNTVYPRLGNAFHLDQLLQLKPLWGSAHIDGGRQPLEVYFWGYSPAGLQMPNLAQATEKVDGPGRSTEIDLILRDGRDLVMVEVKRGSGLGRCGRFQQSACPSAHGALAAEPTCRYWEVENARFDRFLDWAGPPAPKEISACARHYQLGRTLLVGRQLADDLGLRLNLWLIVPHAGWRRLERAWLEFADAVQDHELWRRMRVLSWEAVSRLPI